MQFNIGDRVKWYGDGSRHQIFISHGTIRNHVEETLAGKPTICYYVKIDKAYGLNYRAGDTIGIFADWLFICPVEDDVISYK